MDFVTVIKFFSLLLYPVGLISLLVVIGFVGLRMRRRRMAQSAWLLAVLLFWLFSSPMFAIWITRSLERQHAIVAVSDVQPADAIVVMGGGLRLPTAPARRVQFTNATDRYWLAAQLYNAGVAPKVILLGGNVFEQPGVKAESVYARELLIEWGVTKESILLDTQSRTTAENAANLAKLLSKLPATDGQRLLLVTSAMHMPRSLHWVRLAVASGTTIEPMPADILIRDDVLPSFKYWLPDAGALNLSTLALHEYYGLWFARIQAATM